MNAKGPFLTGLLLDHSQTFKSGALSLVCLTVEVAAAGATAAAIAATVAATAGTAATCAATKTTAATAVAVTAAEAAATRCALDHHVHAGAHRVRLSARWRA